ncbi:hypothetical protein D3C81_2086830 [compost metagenome]
MTAQKTRNEYNLGAIGHCKIDRLFSFLAQMLQIGHRPINQFVCPNIVKAQIQRLCRQLELARDWVFREES